MWTSSHYEGHEEHEEKMICSRQDAKNAKFGIVFPWRLCSRYSESRLQHGSARIFVSKANGRLGRLSTQTPEEPI